MVYEIKRGSTTILAIKASGKQHRAVMVEDRVVMQFHSPIPVTFLPGDTVEVYGQTYELNRPEDVRVSNDIAGYQYELEFEALYYKLGKWELLTYDKDNELKEPEVFFVGTADALIDLIVANANRCDSEGGWEKGEVDETEVMFYSYNSSKLLTVLQDLADKNFTEFWVEGKTINLSRHQPSSGLIWEYGKGKELYELYRGRADKPAVTNLRVLGGSRNIPLDYGYKRLQPTGGNPITVPTTGDIHEETVVFENIYPRRIGEVTAVPEDNKFSDSSIDFNLNNYKLPVPAKVAFTSGQLAGFIFSISDGYDHDTKTITLNVIDDDPAYPGGVPNALLKPAIGDQYVLLDIELPSEYIEEQEEKLQEMGESYLSDLNLSRYNWGCRIKGKYILEQNIELELGSIVAIKHTALGINHNIRISAYTRDLQEEYLYDVQLSNIITISELVRQRNASDQLASSISRAGVSDGNVKSVDTLDSVAKRGSTTDRVLTAGGIRAENLLELPMSPPDPSAVKSGKGYMYLGEYGSGGTPPPEPGDNNGLASVFDISSPLTIDWLNDKAKDENGIATDRTYADVYGNTPFIQRFVYDSAKGYWKDQTANIDVTYATGTKSITHVAFTSVTALTRIYITGKSGQVPRVPLLPSGEWESGKLYGAFAVVSAESTFDPDVQSLYIRVGSNVIESTTPPAEDSVNWMEWQGLQGPIGQAGATILSGSTNPSDELGANGDFYFNTSTGTFYGPKVAGAWPSVGVSLIGPSGKNVEFQKSETHLQWRVVGEVSWNNLVALNDLKGDKGEDGVSIVAQGQFAFSIENGDLILHYHEDDVPPDFEINEDGDLIINID